MDVPTSAVTFIETEHGRMRREQRGIDKKDLQRAKKYGTQEIGPWPRTIKYTYQDIIYIVHSRSGKEITCWAKPIGLKQLKLKRRPEIQQEHDRAVSKIEEDHNAWKSHTVIVVDTSGSMRESDMWGTTSRLAAVWVSVALDYIAHRIEAREASPMDVVSIITLSENPKLVVHKHPWTWLLYNTIAMIYSKNSVPASGPGPFIPSIDKASEILKLNPSASCALALVFLSDGVPSDGPTSAIYEKVRQLARQFGRRLTFSTIGIGADERFEVLQQMAEIAADYGAKSEFSRPSMTSSALGEVFTSVASSLTTTITEMTDVTTLEQRPVRKILRESKTQAKNVIKTVSEEEFYIYPIDRVERTIYKEWWDDDRKLHHSFEKVPLKHPDAKYVAMCKEAFGEGAERFAFRFYEIAEDRTTVLGVPMVAKESRLVLKEEHANSLVRKQFVRKFCQTQQLARRLAGEFNKFLSTARRIDDATPRVTFLDCSIYELNDKKNGKQSVLVEDRLDESKWHKWNANNGYVEGMPRPPQFSGDAVRQAMRDLATVDLGMIEEGDEDEGEEEGNESTHGVNNYHYKSVVFSPSEVAQSFSHFTYWASGRKRLVCDLQGVFDEKDNVLKLSDPVIHYHNPAKAHRKYVHGQTDRGKKGVAMFFETHKDHCGHLCKLAIRRFKPKEQYQDAGSNHDPRNREKSHSHPSDH